MKNSSKVLIALGAGIAIGGVLGVLFAPARGNETRKKISDTANGLSDKLKDAVNTAKQSIRGLRDGREETIGLT